MKAAPGSPAPSRSATARLATGLAALATGLAMVSTAFVGGAAAAEASGISIVQNVTPTEACTPLPQLGYVTQQDFSTFTLIVTAPEKPCTPIDAAAVIYSMPTDGTQWPQSLKERKDFTIAGAGVTEITFTKGCDPEQFDVLTGATPRVIAPDGAWHGPLLFPGDVGTALQWQPDAEWRQENQCPPPETSTTTTTTTLPGGPPPQVEASTTLPPPAVNASTTIATTTTATVAGISATRAPVAQTAGTSTNASASLALTGANSDAVALLGGVLVAAGLVLVLSARRRAVAAAVDTGPEPHRPSWFDPDDRW